MTVAHWVTAAGFLNLRAPENQLKYSTCGITPGPSSARAEVPGAATGRVPAPETRQRQLQAVRPQARSLRIHVLPLGTGAAERHAPDDPAPDGPAAVFAVGHL